MNRPQHPVGRGRLEPINAHIGKSPRRGSDRRGSQRRARSARELDGNPARCAAPSTASRQGARGVDAAEFVGGQRRVSAVHLFAESVSMVGTLCPPYEALLLLDPRVLINFSTAPTSPKRAELLRRAGEHPCRRASWA